MLYAILICTDESCAEEFEAWGELAELDLQVCEGCGAVLQAVSFSEARPAPAAAPLPLRRAA